MGIVIVCEGKSDLNKIKAINKDLIVFTTGGFSFGDELIKSLTKLEEDNQIVLLLDPDFAGEQIRKRLHKYLKRPLDIFMPKEKCQGIGKIGIEHASIEDIKIALSNIVDLNTKSNNLSKYDLYKLGLTGMANSSLLRDKVAAKFSFTQRSSKDFLNKANALNLNYKALDEAVKNV